MDKLFPEFQKSIENLIEDEEGNIPGNKLLALGTMIIILGSLMTMDAFAAHRSHSSHSSHSSGSHGNSHSNHGSHESHQSHQSHTSHSNTGSHSNSRYSAEGDVSYSAPAASNVPKISEPTVEMTADSLGLPEVNQNIQLPNGTPISSILPAFAVPASTVTSKMDSMEMNTPSSTDPIE